MKSRPLILAGCHQNDYNTKEAYAYLYYGNDQQQYDHVGNRIETLSPEKNRLNSFNNHIRTHLIPQIEESLKNKSYTCTDVGIAEMSNAPLIVIMSETAKVLSAEDISTIKFALEQFVEKHNQQLKVKHKTNSVMFTIPHEHDTDENSKENSQSRYDLRPRSNHSPS